MDSAPSFCVEVCKNTGWLGELLMLLVTAFIAARNRSLARDKAQLKTEKASLVEQLSMRPPAAPVSINFPSIPPELVATLPRPPAMPTPERNTEPERPTTKNRDRDRT